MVVNRRITNEDLLGALDHFASIQHSFTVSDVVGWIGVTLEEKAAREAIQSDQRFVALDSHNHRVEHFVAESTLFRFWSYLNLRLALAGQSRLRPRELALSMNPLTLDFNWDHPPKGALRLGEEFGLVAPAQFHDGFVFPVAHILSVMTQPQMKSAWFFLNDLADKEKRDAGLAVSPSSVVDLGMSLFASRTIDVVKAREGLPPYQKKTTLEEIGSRYNVTRERIRQVEAKFWKRMQNRRTVDVFLEGILAEIIRARGSLIMDLKADGAKYVAFLAKCLEIPYVFLGDEDVLVLGCRNLSFAKLDKLGPTDRQVDRSAISKHLTDMGLHYLKVGDLGMISEALARGKLKSLTKTDKVYLALKSIGQPAHYSEVTEVYNDLNPNDVLSVRNVHAILSRCSHPEDERYGIVWVGARGTFALREWGYKRPSLGIFDAVTHIVEQRYEKNGHRPVPESVIHAEIGKYRSVVNQASLNIAIYNNPEVERVSKRSFIPSVGPRMEQGVDDEEDLDMILKEFEGSLKGAFAVE